MNCPRRAMWALPVLTISLFISAARSAEPALPVTAAEATAELFSALAANDIDRAIAMTAPVKDLPAQAMRDYYQRLADQAKKAGTPQIVAHLQLGDTAVVVFREGGAGKADRVDLDPAYAVRQQGRWRPLFKLTRFDRPYLTLDSASLDGFKKLQEWFDAQKPVLQALLAGGGN